VIVLMVPFRLMSLVNDEASMSFCRGIVAPVGVGPWRPTVRLQNKQVGRTVRVVVVGGGCRLARRAGLTMHD